MDLELPQVRLCGNEGQASRSGPMKTLEKSTI